MESHFCSPCDDSPGRGVAVDAGAAPAGGVPKRRPIAARPQACSLVLALAGGLLGTAAQADCSTSNGTDYSCTGTTSSTQTLSGSALNVSADSSFQATASPALDLSASSGNLSVDLAASSTLTTSDTTSVGLRALTTGGSGNIDLTLGGNINSSGLQGVFTDMLSSGNVSITQLAGSSISGQAAIRAGTSGSGSMNLDLAGTLTGVAYVGNSYGLAILGSNTGGPITLQQRASSQINANIGIFAVIVNNQATFNLGGTVHGDTRDGVWLDLGTNMTAFTLNQTAGSIGGARSGIDLTSNNTAPIALNLAGSVTGGTQAAVYTDTASGSTVTINLQNGAMVSSGNGVALLDTLGNANVTIGSGSAVVGKVLLGEGNDNLTISGQANLSGATLLDGGNSLDSGVTDVLGTAGAAINKLTFAGTTQTLAGANLKNWESVTVDNSTLTLSDGTLSTGQGTNPDNSLQGLVLTNGATVSSPVALNISGDINIGANSTLSHALGGSITGNVDNAGRIYWQNLGQTLTINGHYQGTPGSSLSLETYLAGDNSASDQLHVTGNTSGSTAINIRPVAASPGAQTVNGIRVVQVDGTSAAGSFTLAAPVQAGAYQYLLRQGSALDTNDWYLVSQFDCSVTNTCAAASTGVALYRPGVVNYLAAQAVVNEQGMQQLSSFHQRVGSIWQQTESGRRYWVRTYHGEQQADGEQRASYDSRNNGLQVGYVLRERAIDSGQREYWAVTGDYASGRTDVSDRLRPMFGLEASTGAISSSSLAVGGVYNRTWVDGGYVDVVAQWSALSNQFSDNYGGGATQHGWRVGLSVEAGAPVARWGGWYLEPQAQMSYLHTRYNDFSDNSASVAGYSGNALRGRLGVRLATGQPGDSTQIYSIANVYHDFGDTVALAVGGSSVQEAFPRTRWELGAGVQQALSVGSRLYADIRYGRSTQGSGNQLMVNAGLKVHF